MSGCALEERRGRIYHQRPLVPSCQQIEADRASERVRVGRTQIRNHQMRHITQSQSSKLHLNVMFELASAEPLAVLSQLIEPLRNGEAAGEGPINHPVDG